VSSQPNASDQRTKATKGSVQIKNSNGRLQLVFSHDGRRHYLSTGLADIPVNRKVAAFKANIIEEDIFYDRFDPSLEKYRTDKNSGAVLSTFTPVTPIHKPKPSLGGLWDKYQQFKEPSVSANTLSRDYERYRSHITKLPTQSLDDAVQIRD
jgi:integrase